MALSIFTPENGWTIDSFAEKYDYSGADVKNIKRYQELKLKEILTVTEQAELDNLISASGADILRFMLTVEDWNKSNESVVNMQTYFKNKTIDLLNEYKVDMDIKVEDAVDLFEAILSRTNEVREYSPSQTYVHMNLVLYDPGDGTNLYLCIKDCPTIGILPVNAEYFVKLGLKGLKGENGSNFVWEGKWDKDITYGESALVYYNGGMYISQQAVNLGNYPDVPNSAYWLFWQYTIPDGSVTTGQLSQEIVTAINNAGFVFNANGSNKYKILVDSDSKQIYLRKILASGEESSAEFITKERLKQEILSIDGSGSGLDADLFKGNSIIPLASGGTGASNAATARSNLGAASISHATSDTSNGAASTSAFGHVKITSGNGLAISNGIVSMGAASASVSGAITTEAQTIAGAKTFSGNVTVSGDATMKSSTDYSTPRARNIHAGTTDLTAGSSSLANGNIYIVYE